MPKALYVATDAQGRKYFGGTALEAMRLAFDNNNGRLPVTVDLGNTRVVTNKEYEKTHPELMTRKKNGTV